MKGMADAAWRSLGMWWCWPAMVIACPACKDSLFDPGQLHQRLSAAKGYAFSIMLLLSVPLLLISSVAALIMRAQRAQRISRAPIGAPRDSDGKIDTTTLSR